MLYVSLALLLCVAAGTVVFFAMKTEREQIPDVHERYLSDLRREVIPFLPEAGEMSVYSISLADARHRLDETTNVAEFLESLETLCDGLEGFYQSLGERETLARDNEAVERLSKLFK